jgi:hypothetical protein
MQENVRTIQGRRIERSTLIDQITRLPFFRYRDIERRSPIETWTRDAEGSPICILEHRDPIVRWDSGTIGPAESLDRKMQDIGPPYNAPLEPFDPRPESKIHDQLERGHEAGFTELVEAFTLAAKVKERPAFSRGRFPIGPVVVRRGTPADQMTLRRLLADHVNQPVIELDDDQRWCPAMAGQDVVNEVAIQSQSGLVQSVFPQPKEPGRPVKSVHVWTLLAGDRTQTLIF